MKKNLTISFQVDTRPLLGVSGAQAKYRFSLRTPAYQFMGFIFDSIKQRVDPYSYGDQWMLREKSSRRIIDSGRAYAVANQIPCDKRPIGQIGIKPNCVLEVLPIGCIQKSENDLTHARSKSVKSPNTLFLVARFGLKPVDNSEFYESHMWLLDPDEVSMKYVSLHDSKAGRAVKGGQIIEVREANAKEVCEHQQLMVKKGLPPMQDVVSRKIITFVWDQRWSAVWPQHTKSKRAYKGVGFVE